MESNIIIISGPTASGKTSVSIELAKYLMKNGTEAVIVNFDSLLFYRELNIGTAKPTQEERGSIVHELIDIESAKNVVNASLYKGVAIPIINGHINRGRVVILVGGSGFYLRALVKGMYASPTTSQKIKDRVAEIFQTSGIDGLLGILKESDLESFNSLHRNDHYRITRAVEHFLSTGNKLSEEKVKKDAGDPYNYLETIHKEWRVKHFHLDIPKDTHNKIIEERTKQMFKNGFVKEVSSLLNEGFSGDEKPLKSIGYKEVVSFLTNNEFKSEEDCIDRIIISTRQLAKAQRTWFNRSTKKNAINSLSKESLSQITDQLFSR